MSGLGWPGDGKPPRSFGRSTGAGPGKEGLLGGYNGLSPVFTAVGALEAGGRFGRGGGGGWGSAWSGDGKPRVPSGRLTGAGPGKEGVFGWL